MQLYEIPSPFEKEKFKYLELLRHYNFIATASVVFRKTEPIIFPDWFDKITYGDLGLYKIVSKDKSFLCINEVMCVYRIHDGGVYSGLTKKQKEQNYLSFYKTIYKTLNDAEKKIVRVKIKRSLRNIFNLMIFESKVLQRIYTTYDRIKSKFI